MINVQIYGRLGNNLCQYGLGRILATRYQYSLNCSPIKGFPNTNIAIKGAEHETPRQTLRHNCVDMDRLDAFVKKHSGASIYLHGTFAYYPVFEPYKEQIKQWFYLPQILMLDLKDKFRNLRGDVFSPIQVDPINSNDVFLHIRLGDLLETESRRTGRALYFDYYDRDGGTQAMGF